MRGGDPAGNVARRGGRRVDPRKRVDCARADSALPRDHAAFPAALARAAGAGRSGRSGAGDRGGRAPDRTNGARAFGQGRCLPDARGHARARR